MFAAQKLGESCYANYGPKCGDELKCDLKRSMCVSVWETPIWGPKLNLLIKLKIYKNNA